MVSIRSIVLIRCIFPVNKCTHDDSGDVRGANERHIRQRHDRAASLNAPSISIRQFVSGTTTKTPKTDEIEMLTV